jgi:hypothetical protein
VEIEKQEKDKKEKEEKEKAAKSKESVSTEKKMGGNQTRKFREWLMKTQRRYPSLNY